MQMHGRPEVGFWSLHCVGFSTSFKNLELTNIASFAGQLALGIPYPGLPRLDLQVGSYTYWHLCGLTLWASRQVLYYQTSSPTPRKFKSSGKEGKSLEFI